MSLTAPARAASDRDLVGRAARGDERALGDLYDRHAATVQLVAMRIVRERADAEEIVVETFAQAWREAARFDGDRGSVAAWLTMIGRSRALDLVRSRGRRARLADTAAVQMPSDAPAAMGGAMPAPDESAEHAERAERVRAALAELSSPQRVAVELAFFEGLSHSEIAERLDEPLGTVKTRVRLAMGKLRDALRPFHHEVRT